MSPLTGFFLGGYLVGMLVVYVQMEGALGFDHDGPQWHVVAMAALVALGWPVIFALGILQELWICARRVFGPRD